MNRDRYKCFVIMPFGDKPNTDGRVLDFDKIYTHLIKKTVESLDIKCVRCDEIGESGWIHSKMFTHIYEADIAIVDITSLNPNVFYELGVRHALADSVTVILRRKGEGIPFNIQGLQIIEYDPEDVESVEETKKKLADFINNGIKLRRKDSPIHEVLDLKIATESRRLNTTQVFDYRLRDSDSKFICLLTGDIQNVKDVDVWVNSENTNMQMARPYDRSVSGVIRYLGAKRDGAGNIKEDTIANELSGIVGDHVSVSPATVVVTGAGELESSHGVKRIFHVASVVGQVGRGYSPIPDVGMCVRNALERLGTGDLGVSVTSILFPLLGTGTGRGNLYDGTSVLIDAAISFLKSNPGNPIEKVYFLTYSDKHLDVCQRILHSAHDVRLA